MGKVMVIDITKCNGCHNCQIACKDEHVGNDWTPIAKPQPDTGQFWNQVINLERGTVPKVQVTYHHTICQHCDNAPCIDACNAHAIYRRPDGIVIIDPERCRGNQLCMEACPYENVIYFNDDLNIAQKCTRLLAEGPQGRQLHPSHREARLSDQEAGADRCHGCRPERGRRRALEGVSERLSAINAEISALQAEHRLRETLPLLRESSRTLRLLEAHYLQMVAEGINPAEVILEHTMAGYGFASLEQAEAALRAHQERTDGRPA